MSPLIALFQQKTVQEMFERILFIWAIRHPASGYVQGINDLVTPFYVVFLQEFIPSGNYRPIFLTNCMSFMLTWFARTSETLDSPLRQKKTLEAAKIVTNYCKYQNK